MPVIMKKTVCLFLAFIAILLCACSNLKNDAKDYPLQGAWEITYSKYIYPDTIIESTKFANPTVKLLTKKHYAFGRQAGENKITGGGGEYSYDGNTFTSLPKYHSSSMALGSTLVWKSKLEGDLWTISIVYKNDSIQIDGTETWKRIIE